MLVLMLLLMLMLLMLLMMMLMLMLLVMLMLVLMLMVMQGLAKFASSSGHRLKCYGSVVDRKPEAKRKRK
jgi:hypothetical protein